MIKIVQFANGNYGIMKKSIFGTQFLDLNLTNYWHTLESYFITSCQKSSLESVKEIYNKRFNLKPIKELE